MEEELNSGRGWRAVAVVDVVVVAMAARRDYLRAAMGDLDLASRGLVFGPYLGPPETAGGNSGTLSGFP